MWDKKIVTCNNNNERLRDTVKPVLLVLILWGLIRVDDQRLRVKPPCGPPNT